MSALRDRLRGRLLPYTDRAYGMLPGPAPGRVLDIGCGTGVPAVRLAQLGAGLVIGLDPDLGALAALRARADATGVGDRVVVCSAGAEAVPVGDDSVDVVWCEGALWVLGFRESVRAWRRVLRPGGALVAHDEAGDPDEKLRVAEAEGYFCRDMFLISEDAWWDTYYGPASRDPGLEADAGLRDELAAFDDRPERFRSAFFVLERRHR